MPRPHRWRRLILTLVFVSGASGLVYEVVWMRHLTLVFGATAPATSTTLAAFFTGLALGSFLFGRAVDRGLNPLKLYALLEMGIGAFALLMPVLLAGLNDVYVFAHRALALSPSQLTLMRFALSFLLLLAPATLMGGTLPVIVRFFANRIETLGGTAAQLYAINTLGAVAGAFATGFFLILLLGLNGSIRAAAALNLIVAATVLLLYRRLHAVSQAPAAAELIGDLPAGATRLALLTAAVSGFCGLALEVLWTRTLVFYLDNSSHAFSTILTSFLLGIAIGSFLVAKFVDARANVLPWLGAVQILAGLTALLAIPILNHTSPVIQQIATSSFDALLPWKWMGMRFAVTLTVMLVPTILMGITFPLVIKAYTRSIATAGKALGSVYALNTLAGVVGSLLAGFVLIPAAGIHRSIMLIAGANLLAGVVVLLHPAARLRPRLAPAFFSVASIATFAGICFMTPSMDLSSFYERMESAHLLSRNEGIGATVKVFRDRQGDKFLSIDGFPVAGTSPGMQDAQKSLAHIPMLLSRVQTPRVAIIGFGSGGTSSAIYRYGVKDIDCVELVPGVVKAAKWFPEMNRGVLMERDYHLIHGDGRNYTLVTAKHYDVISIDATSPKMAGNGSLYTLEFYRLLKDQLTADGLVVQWLPFHLLSDAETRMTARTFQTVFPNTTLWLSPLRHHGVLVGTIKALRIDVQALRHKLALKSTREELAPMHTTEVEDFLSWFVMGPAALAAYTGDARLNTDDHPFLEFTPALAFFAARRYQLQNLARFQESRESVVPLLINTGAGEAESRQLAERVQRRYEATQFSIRGDVLFYLGRHADARAAYARAIALDPAGRQWLSAIQLL